MREVAERRDAIEQDARETLEPMLDDLARGLGYDRALVLVHDVAAASLRGLFGLNVRDDQARALNIPLARAHHPIVAALRSDIPQRVDDVATDDRLEQEERELLLAMRIPHFVAASLATAGVERATAVVVLGRDRAIEDEIGRASCRERG